MQSCSVRCKQGRRTSWTYPENFPFMIFEDMSHKSRIIKKPEQNQKKKSYRHPSTLGGKTSPSYRIAQASNTQPRIFWVMWVVHVLWGDVFFPETLYMHVLFFSCNLFIRLRTRWCVSFIHISSKLCAFTAANDDDRFDEMFFVCVWHWQLAFCIYAACPFVTSKFCHA